MADLLPCPSCAEPMPAADRFCEACGTSLHVERASTATVAAAPASGRPCPGCGAPLFAQEPRSGSAGQVHYCDECGMRVPDAGDRVVVDLGTIAGISDRGLVHRNNEDAIALGRHRDGTVAAVVCDGVSSTTHPERAARAAADATLASLLEPADPRRTGTGEGGGGHRNAEERVRAAVAAAVGAVAALGDDPDGPSCTLVGALVEPYGAGARITVGWVGDSRAYWLDAAGGAASQRSRAGALTSDHSWAAEAVAAGLLDEAAAAADPRAHAITRWLGPGEQAEPDVITLHPDHPGTLLICSDGLWNYLPDAHRLAEVAGDMGAPLEAARRLTEHAVTAGGRDNISVVLVPVPTGPGEDTRTTGRTT